MAIIEIKNSDQEMIHCLTEKNYIRIWRYCDTYLKRNSY